MNKLLVLFLCINLISGCWSDAQTQMVICASNNDLDCIKSYLKQGQDVNGHGKERASPFYAALRNHNFEIADLFLEYNVDLNGTTNGRTYVEQAILENDYDILRYLKISGVKLTISSSEYGLAIKKNDQRVIGLFE